MPRRLALTGPAAAAVWQLDGYRDHDWPPLWCAPIHTQPGPGIIRTRRPFEAIEVNGIWVATIPTVLRHLGTIRIPNEHDLVELALEHAWRSRDVTPEDFTFSGGRQRGAVILGEVLRRRPRGEPPTESYAETRAVQVFRRLGITPWRQVEVLGGRRPRRADFMIPSGMVPFGTYRHRPRPSVFTPGHGPLVEIDSREFHEGRFEEDHDRETTYDELGYRWLSFTPNQIEHQRARVERVLTRATEEFAARNRRS